MSEEIEALRQQLREAIEERDQARRSWCVLLACRGDRKEESRCMWQATLVASSNGWDCFKDWIAKQPNRWMFDHRSFAPRNT